MLTAIWDFLFHRHVWEKQAQNQVEVYDKGVVIQKYHRARQTAEGPMAAIGRRWI